MKKIAVVILIAIIVVVGSVFGNNLRNQYKLGHNTVTTMKLKKILKTKKLSTTEFTYNGIAEKYEDDSNKVEYYIAYNSKILAGVIADDILIKVNKKDKIVIIELPEIQIDKPTIDPGSLSYIPRNPKNLEQQEIFTLCEDDARKEAEKSTKLKSSAEDNLKKTIEGLITPILDANSYSLKWN